MKMTLEKLSVKKKSTGLGLYIAQKLVKSMGGDVTAKSDGPGKGSEFIIRLNSK